MKKYYKIIAKDVSKRTLFDTLSHSPSQDIRMPSRKGYLEGCVRGPKRKKRRKVPSEDSPPLRRFSPRGCI
jgi:hypothetical protein